MLHQVIKMKSLSREDSGFRLLPALCEFWDRECTDPRDKVFALLVIIEHLQTQSVPDPI